MDAADDLLITEGLQLPVASIGHLIVMKVLARDDRQRPLAADDLRALAEEATEADWTVATSAAAQVTARGFHRERDLGAALRDLREHGAY